ncbi:MAG: TldD/PmbA family protein, partial [Alphaproteobacteria bacterium]
MARRYGADGADAMALGQSSLAVSYRLGKREDIDRAESLDLSLRVFVGRRQAFVSSSDTTADALDAMAARAIAMAQAAPEDPYACLAPRERLWTGGDAQALELADPAAPDAEALFALARAAEEAALAVPGVTNSEGAGASWSRRSFALATSHGFMGERIGTHYALGASVLAGEGSAMQRDYDYV